MSLFRPSTGLIRQSADEIYERGVDFARALLLGPVAAPGHICISPPCLGVVGTLFGLGELSLPANATPCRDRPPR